MRTVEKLSLLALATALSLCPAYAQDNSQQSTAPDNSSVNQSQTAPAQTPSTSASQSTSTGSDTQSMSSGSSKSYAAGKKVKVDGVIVKRNPDSLVLDTANGEQIVTLSNGTKVEERKSNPFRGAKKYAATQLLRGLSVEVEGRTDNNGAIDAQKIRFTNEQYKVARSVESRVNPVEGRVQSAETRLGESEQNQQRLAGQIQELGAISNSAKAGARAAQQTGEMALAGVRATNDRISALDDYEAQKSAAVRFKVGSARLTPEAKQQLDEIADQAKRDKAYVIEVAGFASAEGGDALNRRLSRARAEAVVDYLEANHDIPLRRITMPFGYGSRKPVADNDTRDGRSQNRRVEVTILVNKGILQQAQVGDVSMQSNGGPVSNTPNNNMNNSDMNQGTTGTQGTTPGNQTTPNPGNNDNGTNPNNQNQPPQPK